MSSEVKRGRPDMSSLARVRGIIILANLIIVPAIANEYMEYTSSSGVISYVLGLLYGFSITSISSSFMFNEYFLTGRVRVAVWISSCVMFLMIVLLLWDETDAWSMAPSAIAFGSFILTLGVCDTQRRIYREWGKSRQIICEKSVS